MPNAKVLSEKQAIVAALTEKLQSAAAGVIVDYKGITVAEDTALRAELPQEQRGVRCCEEHPAALCLQQRRPRTSWTIMLNGTTSLAVCMRRSRRSRPRDR